MFEELLKKIVMNDNNIFANYGQNPNSCLVSPQKCDRCQIITDDDFKCFRNQDEVVEKIKRLVRKERLEKLLKD